MVSVTADEQSKIPGDFILLFDKKSRIFKTAIVLIIFLLGGAAGYFAGSLFDENVEPRVRQEPANDGPYVYWKDSGQAVVFYVCNGELITAEFQAPDTIRFEGLCHDSTADYKIPVETPPVENEYYEGVSKIFAVSDIHGEYDHFVDILRKGGVINDRNGWIFGNGHLLIAGDVFDRGEKVTECLWLIYRLEQEAESSGGQVHYLLGNHELMCLRGDLRYVSPKYTDGIEKKGRISYDKLFGERTELGRWLRTKNAITIINGILFVHGGISPELINRYDDIAEVNEAVRGYLKLAPYKKMLGDEEMFVYKSLGPLWYRGFFMELDYPQLTGRQVKDILEFFNAEAVAVGHSETDSVMSHYGGLVYSIDVPADELHSLQALLWLEGVFYRVKGDGETVIFE
jgi:hypothetical protein